MDALALQMERKISTTSAVPVAQLLAANKAEKFWSLTPALIRLYALLLPACLLVCATNGFDGSVLTGLQGVSAWKEQFNHPKGSILGITSAAYPLGAICSTPFSAWVADRFGRRWSVLIGSVIMIFGVIIQTASNTLGIFIGGRVIIGFGVTMALTAAPVLISELTHPRHRVIFGSIYNTSFYLGALLAGWITFGSYRIQSSWAWRLPTLFQAVPALFQVIFIWFLDESPRWLCYKDRGEEAYSILVKYHGNGNPDDELVKAEFHEIHEALRAEKEVKSTGLKLFFKTPGNRKRFFILITLAVFGQWSGNGLVSYYLTKILSSIGITTQHEQTMINGTISTVNWVTAIFAAVLSTKIGRRKMFVGGAIAMFVAFSSLTASIAMYNEKHIKAASQSALAFIFIYFAAFNICLNPLLFLYPTEILPFRLRAMGLSVLVFSNKSASFFNQFINPIGMDSLGSYFSPLIHIPSSNTQLTIFIFLSRLEILSRLRRLASSRNCRVLLRVSRNSWPLSRNYRRGFQ